MVAEVAPTAADGDDEENGYDCASNKAPEPLATNELGLEPVVDLGAKPRWFTPDAARSSGYGAYAATSCSPGVEDRAAVAMRKSGEWWEKCVEIRIQVVGVVVVVVVVVVVERRETAGGFAIVMPGGKISKSI